MSSRKVSCRAAGQGGQKTTPRRTGQSAGQAGQKSLKSLILLVFMAGHLAGHPQDMPTVLRPPFSRRGPQQDSSLGAGR